MCRSEVQPAFHGVFHLHREIDHGFCVLRLSFHAAGVFFKPAPNRRPNPKVSLEMFENYLACLRNGDGAPMALLIAWALSCNCSLSVTDSVDREMIDARAFEQ